MDPSTTGLSYQTHNLLRSVDYRWREALRAVATGVDGPPRHDPETIAAIAYLRELALGEKGDPPDMLDRRWPGLPAAHRLRGDDGPLRWEVQARILSGQTDDEIATRCGLALETVRWFESLFFTVRDRRLARDWIAAQVLEEGLWCGFSREELGKVWMVFGFSAGPLVLDV